MREESISDEEENAPIEGDSREVIQLNCFANNESNSSFYRDTQEFAHIRMKDIDDLLGIRNEESNDESFNEETDSMNEALQRKHDVSMEDERNLADQINLQL
jgi:hypothetical protein